MQVEITREHPEPPPIKEIVLRLSEDEAMFICYLAELADQRDVGVGPRTAARRLYNKLKPLINYHCSKVDFGISI